MKLILALIFALIFLIPAGVSAGNVLSQVKILDYRGNVKQEMAIFDDKYEGNLDVSAIDLGVDGIDEIVVSAGVDNKPMVQVLRSDGTKVFDFMAYADNFRGGVFVSTGDIDGDKKNEIITAPGYNGGPHIRIFKGSDPAGNFFGFNKDSRTGAKVLAADLGGDGISEIIVGSNFGRKPEIAVYDSGGRKIKSAVLDMPADVDGINMAKIDINGDGKQEILVAPAYGGKPEILIFDQNLKVARRFLASSGNYKGGVNVASGDINGDGKAEIIAGTGLGGKATVKVFDVSGSLISEFAPFGEGYDGGVKVAVGNFGFDKNPQIVAVPERIYSKMRSGHKYIEVDLSKQTLYYWQNGYRLGKFLISSGKSATPTPKGEFSIFKKRPSVTMSWYYGQGSPMNYNLPNVPWVASFKGPYTIHGTYWHSNFGNPMSHGCINMYTPHAKIIYEWVDIGTPIIIY